MRRLFALCAVSLAAGLTAASAIPMNELFMRQSSCAANFIQCKNANFPNYFCCPSGQRCISLAGNTTLLCCPEGSDCQKIQPVPCDLSLQDGETNPDAVVKTTALGGTLGRCGGQCCPFGFSCDGKDCVMDSNQNAVPIQTRTGKAPTSTSSARTSATSGITSTTSSSTPANPTNSADPSATSGASDANTASSGPPTAAIAGGVVGGAIILLGLAALAFILTKKKKEKSAAGSPPKLSRSTSSFGNLISGPIMVDNGAIRSDFARVTPPRDPTNNPTNAPIQDPIDDPASVTGALLDSSANTPDPAALAVPAAAASRQSGLVFGGGGGGYGGLDQPQFVEMPYVAEPDDGGGGLAPQTPRQHREPSSVSINIFADPNITPDRTPESNAERRYTNMTTFTQMLDRADLGGMARGGSYLDTPPVPKR